MPYTPYQMPFAAPFQQQQYAPSMPTQVQPMPVQQPGIAGHMVGSHEEIKPNDVPMNGTAAYFPAQDGSVIYAKAWNPDGSITTVRYTPAVEPKGDETESTPTLFDIMDQLSDIQDLLKAQRKPATTKRATAKKEASDDASD